MKVFENQTANGTSIPYQANGGVYQIQIDGNFDGGEMIQTRVSQEGLPPHPQTNGNKTGPSTYRIFLKPHSELTFLLSGASAGTNITISVI